MTEKTDGRTLRGAGLKLRTDTAIIAAVAHLVITGEPVITRKVAEVAGVSQPTVYNHYATLQSLVDAAAPHLINILFNEFNENSASEAIEHLIDIAASNQENIHHLVTAMSAPKRNGTQLSVQIQQHFGHNHEEALRQARTATARIVERNAALEAAKAD